MISVRVKPNENINRALSRFKSAVLNEGIIKTVNDKSHYVKPSLKKKLKSEAVQRQRLKDEIKLIRQIENEQKEWRS